MVLETDGSASKPVLAQDVDYSSVSAATWSYFGLVSVAKGGKVRTNPSTVMGLLINTVHQDTSSMHFFPLKSPGLVVSKMD